MVTCAWAREIGVNDATLGRWVSVFKARNETGQTEVAESERAELLRLWDENAALKILGPNGRCSTQ